MSFSVKQLFGFVLVIALGLVALGNSNKPIVESLAKLVVFSALILSAYGIWISCGETRAFRVGFLCWGGLYFVFHVFVNIEKLDFGTSNLIGLLVNALAPKVFSRDAQGVITGVHGEWYDRFFQIAQCALSMLVGILGGWLTVFFYHKRQQMLGQTATSDAP